ncbi:MAG: type II secretion system secretin GspD [Sandaracinaceae bacterium]
MLNLNGLTVVRRGRYHVITDSQEVARRPTAVADDASPPPADERFVTWIHRVEHMPVAEASQLLDGLRSTEGRIVPYEATHTLIVIDTGANIQRMRRVLAAVDVAQSDSHVWVESIHFANAEDLVTTLTAIFGEERAAATPTPARPRRAANAAPQAPAAATPVAAAVEHAPMRFLADTRTNSLLMIGTAPEYRRALQLLAELDRRDREASAAVHVRRLQHSVAESVTATLQSLLGTSSGGTPAAGATPTAAIEGLRGQVRIEAHEDLNALVITATPADYRVVSQLVDELDVAPRQVFLEMALMELSVDEEDSLGLDLLGGIGGLFGENLVGALANLTTGGIASATNGFTLGAVGPNIPGTSTPSFGVELQALAQSQQTNVISTPYVMAIDNREAVINIGQNIPLQGSSVAGLPTLLSSQLSSDAASSASALSALSGSSGGRRDTGTIMTITPHINDDGEVRMEISAEDSRQGARVGNLDASVITQSIATTELVARDGQTVVIGGMMHDSQDNTQSGIPVLSQIPILGALFGQQGSHTQRRNLLFFITPHIVRGPADVRAIFERRLRERREFLERHMAFEGDWEPPIDYSRTRGLVAEMLDVLASAEAEAEAAAIAPPPDPEHVPRAPLGEDGEEGEDDD